MVEGWRRSKQNGREIRNGIIALRWCTSEEDFDGKTSMSLARVAVKPTLVVATSTIDYFRILLTLTGRFG